jgi:hypothetical protein
LQCTLKSFGDGAIAFALRILDEKDFMVNEKLRQQQPVVAGQQVDIRGAAA